MKAITPPATGPAHPGTGWRIPFVRPDLPSFDFIAADIREAVTSGSLTKGCQLDRFEAEARAVCGTSEMVAVSSCTSGLMLVMAALERLGEGCGDKACLASRFVSVRKDQGSRDEIIVPSFIFLAAPAAIVWAGYRPVFVDVDPATFTVDPAAVEAAITPRTAAILACHTFGCPCDVGRLSAAAEKAGVPLIVDAAHGLGSTVAGRQVGGGCLAQVFSLSPTKLVVAGEGGLVATSCRCLADAIRIGREYGNDGSYGCCRPGLNARMPEMAAAVGRASLSRLPEVARRRRAAAAAYAEGLRDVPGLRFQEIPSDSESSCKDVCVFVDAPVARLDRDALRTALADQGIDTRAYYSPACHAMEAFRPFVNAATRLPVTERLASSLVALPMGGHVTVAVAGEVAAEIRRLLLPAPMLAAT